jgi:hypothetical protein
MTTIIKNPTITHKIVEGCIVRSVLIAKRKYYFVGDLTDVYGSSFLSKLATPCVIKRVSDGSNSQQRRLVTATDFNNALKIVLNERRHSKKTSRKVTSKKITAPKTTQMTMAALLDQEKPSNTQEDAPAVTKIVQPKIASDFILEERACWTPPVKRQPVANERTKANASGTENEDALEPVKDLESATSEMLRSQINMLVDKHAKKKGGDTASRQDQNQVRMDLYRTLYQEFDRTLASNLGCNTYELKEYKLGLTYRTKGGVKYLDRIQESGYLALLANVAKKLFTSSK